MKSKLILAAAFFLFSLFRVHAQQVIEINITQPDKATIDFFKDKAKDEKTTLAEYDFTKSSALLIHNSTTTNQYKVSVGNNIIPAARITAATIAGTPVTSTFQIGSDGMVQGLPVKLTNDMEIKVETGANPSVLLASVKGSASPVDPSGQTNNTKNANSLFEHVKNQISEKEYKYVSSQNIIVDKNGVIHIYLDEDLSPIYSYFPTMAKEGYDKFQFHMISTKNYSFTIESAGKFDVTPLTDDIAAGGHQKIHATGKKEYFQFDSPIFGPYSGSFPFTIRRKLNGTYDGVILDRTIKLLKVSRVSLDLALASTWLRNPENISTFVLPNGDTTLIADNPDVRGKLVAMLTFHFKPRNLTIPSRTFNERLGISVGMDLREKLGTNFFTGLNVEIANGFFINGGVHFGEINYPIQHKEFDFGTEKFSGTLESRKRWDAKPYLAVSIDAALFVKAFQNLFSSPAP